VVAWERPRRGPRRCKAVQCGGPTCQHSCGRTYHHHCHFLSSDDYLGNTIQFYPFLKPIGFFIGNDVLYVKCKL
jgi:hypothetical protein